MKYFNTEVNSPVGFPEERRVGTCFTCYRFRYFGDGWECNSEKKECIDLKVNKDIKLYGIRMFGRENDDFNVNLQLTDTQDNTVLATKSGKFSSVYVQTPLRYHFYGFDIWFDSLVELEKDVKYCVSAIIDGPDSCEFGVNGQFFNAQCRGVKFSSYECTENNRGATGVNSGQFAAFLFRPR